MLGSSMDQRIRYRITALCRSLTEDTLQDHNDYHTLEMAAKSTELLMLLDVLLRERHELPSFMHSAPFCKIGQLADMHSIAELERYERDRDQSFWRGFLKVFQAYRIESRFQREKLNHDCRLETRALPIRSDDDERLEYWRKNRQRATLVEDIENRRASRG